MPAPPRRHPARVNSSSWRALTPLLVLLLLVGGVVLLSSTDGVPEGVRGAVVGGKAPSTKDRRLAERAPGGSGAAAGLHAGASLRDRYGSDLGSLGEKDSPVGREDRGLSGRLRQEAEERQAVAYLRDVGGMAQQQPRRAAAGTKPGAGSASKPMLQAGGAAGMRGILAPGSSPPLRARYHWPPLPPSPPPPPPPAADPAPGTYKFVRPNCADRVDQCKLWKEYGECRNNPGYMYYNCGGACAVCNVTYLHWNEVTQKREIAPGVWMPSVGFGTAGLGDYTRDVVVAAIRAGYRGVDSAEAREWYREDLVGQGVWLSGVKREHMFITSKLHPRYHGYWNTLAMHAQTLRDLRTDYVDLFLLHYPECWGSLCGGVNPEGTWKDSWAAMEELVHEGSVRAIGVSNFNIAQLVELLAVARIKPALVQVRMDGSQSNSDPLRQDAEVQAFCRLHGITYQGYSTLGGQWLGQYSGRNPVLLHPTIGEIATRKQRTPAQVVLRWALQHNQLVVPRTTKLNRMTENLQVFDFDLSDTDMQKIDGLDGTSPVFPQEQLQQAQQW